MTKQEVNDEFKQQKVTFVRDEFVNAAPNERYESNDVRCAKMSDVIIDESDTFPCGR